LSYWWKKRRSRWSENQEKHILVNLLQEKLRTAHVQINLVQINHVQINHVQINHVQINHVQINHVQINLVQINHVQINLALIALVQINLALIALVQINLTPIDREVRDLHQIVLAVIGRALREVDQSVAPPRHALWSATKIDGYGNLLNRPFLKMLRAKS
jgi:hypothetical protein